MKLITHKHHIIPKHVGGTDDPSNIIVLTIEEHAEAHRVLYEKYGRTEDRLAWLGLSGQIGKDEILLELARSRKGEKRSVEFCENMSRNRKGHTVSEETRKKIGDANRGRILSAESRNNIRLGLLGRKQTEHQKETIRNLRKKTYEMIDPSGNTFTITNLSKFCKDNNLDQGNMHKSRIKGWSCKKII